MAQKLSHQLRAAEGRIAELEAEVGIYQDKGWFSAGTSGFPGQIKLEKELTCGKLFDYYAKSLSG
jgi:hypothetical protein